MLVAEDRCREVGLRCVDAEADLLGQCDGGLVARLHKECRGADSDDYRHRDEGLQLTAATHGAVHTGDDSVGVGDIGNSLLCFGYQLVIFHIV